MLTKRRAPFSNPLSRNGGSQIVPDWRRELGLAAILANYFRIEAHIAEGAVKNLGPNAPLNGMPAEAGNPAMKRGLFLSWLVPLGHGGRFCDNTKAMSI